MNHTEVTPAEQTTREFIVAVGGLAAEIVREGSCSEWTLCCYIEGAAELADMRKRGVAPFSVEQVSRMEDAIAEVGAEIRRHGLSFRH